MDISYKINNNRLLNVTNFPLNPNKILVITGIENENLNLFSGILGKLFPITNKIDIPQINTLMTNFSGDLEITNGNLPQNISYLSPDPDRHFLFATIKEEFSITKLPVTKCINQLKLFGLDQSFYERKISSLSGGEKMKFALALTFLKPTDCYVLHGIIPWLDKTGRDLLINHVKKCKNQDSTIIFIEHELDQIQQIADGCFWFDGNAITPYLEQPKRAKTKLQSQNSKTQTNQKLLEFKQVTLNTSPFFEIPETQIILNNISFEIHTNDIYALIGDNGAGKSTIAQMIFRIIEPTTGTINFLEQDLIKYSRAQLNKLVCYVGQFPAQQITKNTLGQYIAKAKKENNQVALEIISQHINLSPNTPISTLSLLQTKLLILANNITSDTKLIILDEPTWGIDKTGQKIVWEILHNLQQTQTPTIFLITHDIHLIDNLTTKIINLKNGKINLNF